jgi:hypothetical protein
MPDPKPNETSSRMFRNAALEKLSTPEQLDQLVRVTTPASWLALAALGCAIAAAAFWGFYGRIPLKVEGHGVIIRRGGTFNIVATNAGRIVELNIPADHVIGRGMVIARVAPPDLAASVIAAKGDLADLVEARRGLAAKSHETSNDQLQRADAAIDSAKRRVDGLEAQLPNAEIVSPIRGHILSLQAAVGDLVNVGTVLCNVELGDNDLIASVYVSPADARKIGPHALVQLSPADVRREEFGYMLGRVSHVSRFPTTEHEMMYLLENESLVRLLSSHGPPLGIEVELLKDRSTFSGFKWTTATSPPVAITSGTICTAQIVVGERRPIDMLIPHVRETLGI